MPLSPAEITGISLLAFAAAGWFASSRAAADALTNGQFSPGRAAVGYWLPTLLTVITAIVLDKPELALRIIFASSIACLTLALGIVTIAAENTQQTSSRRMWGFVLPASLICLMIGFGANLRALDAGFLLLEGAALASLWRDGDAENSKPIRLSPQNGWQLIAALLAGCVAAWAGIRSAHTISNVLGIGGYGVVTATLIGPLLVLPMIGAGSNAAHQGKYDQAVTAQIGYVLLNLCALLPLATILWIARSHLHWPLIASPTTMPTTLPTDEVTNALAYPLAVWRVDTVLLAVLGLFLLPVALGKWTLGRVEGLALMGMSLIYMAMTAMATR